MSVIRLYRMTVLTFAFFISYFSCAQGLNVSPWRVRADAYVASTNQTAQGLAKQIITEFHDAKTRDEIEACIKRVECAKRDANFQHHALCVKAISALYEYVRKNILTVVCNIDAQIEFLEYRKTHPITMLFYRPLSSWQSKKTNYELQNDINVLRGLKENYLQSLGNLILAIESFPHSADAQETEVWVSRVAGIMVGESVSINSGEQLVAILKRTVATIEHEQKANNVLTREALTSNRIETGLNYAWRAGVFSIAALVAGGGFWLGCKMTSDAKAELAIHEKEVEDALNTLAPEKTAEKKSTAPVAHEQSSTELQQPTTVADAHVQSTFGSQSSSSNSPISGSPSASQDNSGQGSPRGEEKSDLNRSGSVSSFSQKFLNGAKSVASGVKKAANEVVDKANGKIEQLKNPSPSPEVRPVPFEQPKQGMTEKISTGVVNGALQNPNIMKAVDSVNKLLESAAPVINKISDKLDGVTGPVLYSAFIKARKTATSIIKNEIITKAGIVVSGSSLVVGGVAALCYAMRIASNHGKIYTAMKKGMLNISYILASYDHTNQTMSAQDLGALAYIGSRLNEYASAVLSYEESQFLASDIAQLQIPGISIVNKAKLVQRMYTMYSFLVPPRAIII